jgi:hypothetical protein
MTRMYYLDLKTFVHAFSIWKKSTFVKMSEWDEKRAGMMKDISEVEILRSRFRTNQIDRLSGYAPRQSPRRRGLTDGA